jgi:hypothetical protein
VDSLSPHLKKLKKMRISGTMSKEEQEVGEYCIMKSVIFCTPRLILLGCPIKASEMGGALNKYGSEEKMHVCFCSITLRKKTIWKIHE